MKNSRVSPSDTVIQLNERPPKKSQYGPIRHRRSQSGIFLSGKGEKVNLFPFNFVFILFR